jgi:hypothetical protein
MVHEELRTSAEEIGQRARPLRGLEAIVFVDPDPRQRLPPPGDFVGMPRELLFRLEQVEPRRQPLLT